LFSTEEESTVALQALISINTIVEILKYKLQSLISHGGIPNSMSNPQNSPDFTQLQSLISLSEDPKLPDLTQLQSLISLSDDPKLPDFTQLQTSISPD